MTSTNFDDAFLFVEHIAEMRRGPNDYPALMVLDDCHSMFNSRNWNKNTGWIEFLSNSRKLGYHVLLVTHSDQMIDKQIRNFVEYQSFFRSLRRVFIPYIPFDLPILPWPIPEQFFYVTRYYGQGLGRGEVAKRGVFGLSSHLPYSTGTVFSLSGIQGDIRTYGADSVKPHLLTRILQSEILKNLRDLRVDRKHAKPVNVVECARHIIFRDGSCILCKKHFC